MRGLLRRQSLCKGLLWVLLAWMLGSAGVAHAAAQQLVLAQATVRISGQESLFQTSLPYAWDKQHRGAKGHAVFQMELVLGALPDEPWAMYFQRLGNAYEVQLNGKLLEIKGDLDVFDEGNYGQEPRLISIPVGMLQPHNTVVVEIRADTARRAGMAAPWVGTHDEVVPLYRSEYLQRVTGTRAVVISSLLVMLLALALWWTQVEPGPPPRREPLYLLAAVAEAALSLRMGSVLVESSPLPRLGWDVLTLGALGVWVGALMMFSALAAGWPALQLVRRMPMAWLGVLALGAGCIAAAHYGYPMALTLWYLGLLVFFLPYVFAYCWVALRRGTTLHRLIALAFALNLLVGVRDWWVFRYDVALGGNTWMRYSGMVFGLVLGYIVMSRFRETRLQLGHLIGTLAQQVQEKERELHASYQQMELLARQQERDSERSRILRDLHDGVGSHISAAIRQLQSGQASQVEVLQTLRDSLDQLKLHIDAMHLPAGDVTGLLASLRYRLEPRLAGAGITLAWDVDLVPPVQQLDAAAMRHLQYMVFEAVSNVQQHARASRLRVEAKARGQAVVIRIEDNGIGFGADRPSSERLRTLRERARLIRALLDIRSSGEGSVVEIILPR